MTDIKQVIVVRKDLKMRKGKLAAQVAHASMKVLLKQLKGTPSAGMEIFTMEVHSESPMCKWMLGDFTKVVVGVGSLDELKQLQKEAIEYGILHAVVIDSGKTEFHGVPTLTCLAIGPDYFGIIDKITGHLKLL